MIRVFTSILASMALHYPALTFLLHGSGGKSPVDSWCVWDCDKYLPSHCLTTPGAFFPLMSLAARGAGGLLPVSETGALLICSTLFSLLASSVLLFLGQEVWKSSSAPTHFGFKREAWILTCLVTLFPQHFFALAGYSESLFLLLFSAGLLLGWKDRPVLAAVPLSLTAVTRPQGIWVVGLTGLYWLWKTWQTPKDWKRLLPAMAILPLPFAAFLYWNWSATGNALHFLSLQKNWGRTFEVWGGLLNHLPRYDDSRFLLYCALGFAWVTLRSAREGRWKALAILAVVFAEVPVFYGGFYSYPRLMSVNLGLFILGADVLAKRPVLFLAWSIWSVTRLGTLALTYTAQGWAG